MAILKWTRSVNPKETGLMVYTSGCGRFVIHQKRSGWTGWVYSSVRYLLDVDGQPALMGYRNSDLLRDAKRKANMIAESNGNPV